MSRQAAPTSEMSMSGFGLRAVSRVLKGYECSQCFPRQFMDVGSLLGSIVRTVLNYEKGSYVHCKGP